MLCVVRGKECVENLTLPVSDPTDLVINGDWITPSALLHFSCDIRLQASDGVSDWERCFFDGNL